MPKRAKVDLRKFRSQVAALKRAGLIDPKTDARKAKPTPALSRAISRYDDVLSGKATAVKVKPSTARRYRKAGWETARGNRVIQGHLAGQKVRIDESLPPGAPESIKIVNPISGIERVMLPVGPDETAQFLQDNPEIVESLKTGRQRWGFTVDGYPSITTFPSLERLLDYVRHYKPRAGFRPSNLVIYRVRNEKSWQKKVRRTQSAPRITKRAR